MFLWPDHLTCPDLQRWLPAELADRRVRSWVHPAIPGWGLPSTLRELCERWPLWSVDDAQLEGLVLFTPLSAEPALAWLESTDALVAGARIVDVSTVARPLRWWLEPWAWRRRAAALAVGRAARWALEGLTGLEQYVALTPTDAVVTLGSVTPRRRPPPSPP